MGRKSTKSLPARAIGRAGHILDPLQGVCFKSAPERRCGRISCGEAEDDAESGITALSMAAVGPAVCRVRCVGGCGLGGEARYPTSRQPGQGKPVYDEQQSVFGPGGLSLGGTEKPGEGDSGGGGAGVGVNSFLWRASLDTVSFMPLVSADPFGGVIITDWYSPPQSPDERFKVNVYILGRALRADGIRASVFRQQMNGTTGWVDAQVAPNTGTDLENAILTRARQMRIAQLGE
jgi:hypothetical protein